MKEEILKNLKDDIEFMSHVTRWETLPEAKGRYEPFPSGVDPLLQEIYQKRGISRLYSHQREAFETIRLGKNAVIVTPTASGKTLCYNLPVLDDLLRNPAARALYLFPTKALSQDQQSELNEVLLSKTLPVKAFTYDGDTPSSLRVTARDGGRVIITNPDMLHAGILPNHPKWIKFLKEIRYIVIDEIHIYRGIFGSHVANVIRRLKRICRFYGSDPCFICCSATIGNPLEHASRIIGGEAVLLDKNGAPSGEKHFVLYNPPLVDAVQGIRRGVVLESQKLALRLLRRGIKTIVFCRSRLRTELIAAYINRSLQNVYNDNHRIRVESYRGGYLPQERRKIEKGLRSGEIQGVVSTNALELGIDIGGLDASLLAGFPGSFSSARQQAGRAGRRNRTSLAILIASSAPQDQYMVNHSDYFFGHAPESAWTDPDNLYILLDHLKCAVFEAPFGADEEFGAHTTELLAYLEGEGVLRLTEGHYYWTERGYPAEEVSLRSATAENVVIINETGGKNEVIGEMDRPGAKEMLYDQAVYIHRGQQFQVRQLDIENLKCFVTETDVNYYTDALVKTDIKVLESDTSESQAGAVLTLGDVLVRRQAAKFKKIRYNSHENIGYGEIHLPEEEMHTRSLVIRLAAGTPLGDAFVSLRQEWQEHIIGRVANLLKNTAPLFLLCDRSNIGVAERLRDPHYREPVIYLYDNCPGGIGLAEGLLRELPRVLTAALELITECPCEAGCPSCIGPDDSGVLEGNLKQEVLSFFRHGGAG